MDNTKLASFWAGNEKRQKHSFCGFDLQEWSRSGITEGNPSSLHVGDNTNKGRNNQLSKAGGLVAFPSNGQSQQQQKADEFLCYQWALEQTGIDPLNLPKKEVVQETGPTGGAARGAAAGAAIGAIAGDAGEGAAIGAVVGGLRGRRAGQAAQQQRNQQSQA
jgi:hypothetical protein